MKNKVREARKLKGISQLELAQLTGISRQTLSKIENNEEINTHTVTIVKIADALKVNPGDIFLF